MNTILVLSEHEARLLIQLVKSCRNIPMEQQVEVYNLINRMERELEVE